MSRSSESFMKYYYKMKETDPSFIENRNKNARRYYHNLPPERLEEIRRRNRENIRKRRALQKLKTI